MRKRTKSRIWALQALYSALITGRDTERALREFFDHRRVAPQNREFAVNLVRLTAANLERIDGLLESHLENWSLQRLSVLDRIMIRLATAEFLFFEDVPPKVTIDEYLHLAHMFGTGDSPRFINGVLDAVLKGLPSACDL
ncbi:MAG: transcription antitermination factor NusB [Gemmatimonadota bacterium]|nr:transcription antitermination factor NusB [Gemmatimonadota bacterium]